MADLTGVWTSCFMLMFALVSIASVWMHLAIRRMERREVPGLRDLPQLPDLEGLGESAAPSAPKRPRSHKRRPAYVRAVAAE